MSLSTMSYESSSTFSESETEPPKSKMDYLLLALWIMNPNDIDPPPGIIIIPKTPKRKSYPSKKNRMKALMQVDHTYCAPRPAPKLCIGCNKASRYKRLIQCDYCPLAYHQSCLNPPLTSMPNGSRWMCPNHPQYLIDCVASLPAFAALELSARALPVHTVVVGENVNMGTIVMKVGTADGCELRLDAALCHRVSSNHAAIYVNEATREFKLINYSEYGSAVIVNGVVFSLDVAQAHALSTEGEARASASAQTVPLSSEHPCRCRPRYRELTHGASMLIPHGCLLEFGCQIFLFSITPVKSEPVSWTTTTTTQKRQ